MKIFLCGSLPSPFLCGKNIFTQTCPRDAVRQGSKVSKGAKKSKEGN